MKSCLGAGTLAPKGLLNSRDKASKDMMERLGVSQDVIGILNILHEEINMPSSKSSSGNTSKRGFASMDRDKQREIASKGGKAAHAKGTAHEFDSEEAREAGRKGGEASHGGGRGGSSSGRGSSPSQQGKAGSQSHKNH